MRRFDTIKVVRWIIVAVIFAFLGRMVWGNWREVKDASFTFRSFPFIWGTLIFTFSYFIQLWAWYLITARLGIDLSFRETMGSWFYSQLGKYLPGKVWLLVSRFYFYESKGKSKKTISVALYFETVTIITTAGLLSWASLILFQDVNSYGVGEQSRWLVLLFIPVFVFLHPKVLQKLFNGFLRRLKKEPIVLSLSYGDVLWIVFVCLLSWVVGGIGFYLFIDSVYSVPAGSILYLTGALAFSSILGLIALFAPGGLGVREGALVYLLSFTMPGSVAVILSVLTRLWMTLIEIGLIGVIYLFSQFLTRLKKKDLYA
ncbi:MAG: lysylphosphatidylglycerol synthase domain-containing protein [Deltaproteobacteria bacterium]